MSHMQGHVEEGAESCGILRLEKKGNDDSQALYFIPPKWKANKDDEVGFHVLEIPTGDGQAIMVAYDIVKWDHHLIAEKFFLNILKSKFNENYNDLESIDYGKLSSDKKQIVLDALEMVKQPELREVIEQTIRFMQTSEFEKYYRGKNSENRKNAIKNGLKPARALRETKESLKTKTLV